MKHCSYVVLTNIKYIIKKLAKEFIFQNQALQQQMCVNYMKLYQEKVNIADSSYDKNNGHTEEDLDYIHHKINKTAQL